MQDELQLRGPEMQDRLQRKINEALISFNADLQRSNYRPDLLETLILVGCRVIGTMVSSAVMEGIGAYNHRQKALYKETPYLGPFDLRDTRHQLIHGLLIGALP